MLLRVSATAVKEYINVILFSCVFIKEPVSTLDNRRFS